MLENKFIHKTHIVPLWAVFGLAIIALGAELLPEIEAKVIVIPTLILVIGLVATELYTRFDRVVKSG